MDECRGTTYVPEVEEGLRKEQERRVVQEGAFLWKTRKEELQRQKHREQYELQAMLKSYSPWGKPGGGAPCETTLRKKNVPLEPSERVNTQDMLNSVPWGRPGPGGAPWRDPKLLGVRFLESLGWMTKSAIKSMQPINPQASTEINKLHDANARKGITPDPHPGPITERNSGKAYNEEVQVYRLTGGVELVPLLTCRRHYSQSQPIRHLITDARKSSYTLETLRALAATNREYIAELADQIRRKRERNVEEQRMEKERCRRHFDTWKSLWGKPGHGAPIDHVQRSNLYNILYRPSVY
ncbi:uncharacterized protein LOC127281370 [Leptopilina boulardi]|uniref:uncharacterized protein LOC127281370 n=1 Tax=Leptopilina boulardi TaxID=63433 RepID=UPI0021F60AE6|nr:uncharacterized protein LOC127281370 [Leptopilina boulardi]